MSNRLSYAPSKPIVRAPFVQKPYALHSMNIAGPEDEQTGDEQTGDELEGIRFFDFTDPFESSERHAEPDPFASAGLSTSSDAADINADINEETDTERETEQASAQREPVRGSAFYDPFEHALTGAPHHQADSTSTPAEPLAEPATEPPSQPKAEPSTIGFFQLASLLDPAEPGSRERFVSVFDACRAEDGLPFLAIALRIPAGDRAAAHFPVVVEGLRSALDSDDALLADDDRLRLVAVFRGRREADARVLFAQLKDYLRTWVDDADDMLRAISAFVAPEGRPFHDANEFLARAYDNG